MAGEAALSVSTTETQFDNGYWYTADLRRFAREIGVPSFSTLRKDELEKSIRHFLRTGEVKNFVERSLSKTGVKDVERGLSLDLPVVRYTSNKETKGFIVREARTMAPDLRERSGD